MSGSPQTRSSILGIVFFTVFLDLIGFGILIPIQPFYAQKLGASPSVITLLGASFSAMQFLFGSFWGRLSDRIGRRPVMLISIALTAFGYLLFGLSSSLTVLFIARMLSGLGSANIGTAQAIIADSTDAENRAKGMGLIGAAFGLGFIFGPVLGGLVVKFGLEAPAFVAAGLSAINWVIALIRLPETNPVKEAKALHVPKVTSRPQLSWAALKHAARHPQVGYILAMYLIFSASFSMMENVLGLFIQHYWVPHGSISTDFESKHAASLTAYMLIVVGVTATIVQGYLIGKLAKRFGEKKLLVVGPALVALAFFLIPEIGWSGVYGGMLLVAIIMASGTGITHPSLSSLLSRSVDADEQGGTLGLGQSLAALGRVLGPSVSGLLFQVYPGLPFWTGSILLLITSLLAVALLR
ncbi:MFS transporter [bacterium]|nr:MFS transporter [bacterium]NBX82276.1 MFS transporter [bacterium]